MSGRANSESRATKARAATPTLETGIPRTQEYLSKCMCHDQCSAKASSLEVPPDGVAPAGGGVNYSAPVSYPVGFYIESGGVVSDPLLR